MNWVGKFDQIKQTYTIDRKHHKWWHKIFLHFVDACIACILYKITAEKPKWQSSLKEFRLRVIKGLDSETYVFSQKKRQ